MLLFLNPDRFDAIRVRVNADPEFRLTARAMAHRVHLSAGASASTFRIESGQVVSIRLNPFLEPHDFAITAAPDAWDKLLSPKPPPFYHHLYAAMFRRTMTISGDLEAAFSSLAALSRMIDL